MAIPGLVLTDEQRKTVEAARAAALRDKPEVIAASRRQDAILGVSIRNALLLLLSLRKADGVTLADIAELTGIAKSSLSRLENDPEANVTLGTLVRVADALGYELQIGVVRKVSKKPKTRRPKA